MCNPADGKRNLLKATYKRIGNVDGVSEQTNSTVTTSYESSLSLSLSLSLSPPSQPFPETTLQEAMSEVNRLKGNFTERPTHKSMIAYENFLTSTQPRCVESVQ